MRSLILLAGRKRTGKGTAFEVINGICKNAGEFVFAKPIKDFCINALGLTHAQMYGTNEERESITKWSWGGIGKNIRLKYGKKESDFLTAREVLQVVGTDIMREQFNQRVWADAGIRQALDSPNQCCVLTDARMKNELEAGLELADAAQNFLKPIIIRTYRKTGLVDGHLSETDLDCFDAIPNQRALEQGVPEGFVQLASGLYTRTSGTNPFNYLIDNNTTLEAFKFNMAMIIGHWLRSLPNECSDIPQSSNARGTTSG